MSPYLRLISWWCLQGLQLNCCVLTRRKNGPIETALSGHASAVLRVTLTKETVCVAWLLYILSALAASRRLTKTHERNSDKHPPNFHAVLVLCPYINKMLLAHHTGAGWLEQVGCNSLYHPSKLATQAFLRRCDTSRPLEEYLSRTRTFVILKRALSCAIDQRAPWRTLFFDFAALFHHT